MFEWDDDKLRANLAKHGLDFGAIARFDWATATNQQDRRRDYGETRMLYVGRIDGRLHVVIVAPRDGALRIISLRKANKREIARWKTQSPR